MAYSVDSSELQAIQGFVRDNRDTVLNLMLRGAPSLQHFSLYPGVRGSLLIEHAELLDIIKPWACDFAPDPDTIKRTPVEIVSHFQKAELRFCPKTDFFHYKGHLMTTKQSAKDYTFAQWAVDQGAKRMKTQQEFQQIFTGDKQASPANAGEMYDGLLTTILKDQALGAPLLTPVTTGVLTLATIIDQVEQMDDSIQEEYRVDMLHRVSPEVFKMYRRAYRAASGYHPDNADTDEKGSVVIDGTSSVLVSCPGMRGSQRIISTPKWNTYYAFDDPTDDGVFEGQQLHRFLDLWSDFWGGVGFLLVDPRILYINDQV